MSWPDDIDKLVDSVWEALKGRCCSDPAKAKRIVMIGRDDLSAAISISLRQAQERIVGDWPR